jgi:integrase
MTKSIVINKATALSTEVAGYREALKQVGEEIAKQLPPNTKLAYDGDFRKFEIWCTQLGFKPLPATEESITGYMTHLALGEKRKPSTILRRLFGIAYRHRRSDHPTPITPAVRAHLRNLRRQKEVNTTRKEAPPLLVPELKIIVAALDGCTNDLREIALRDKAIMLIGWNCAFRRSEIVGLEVRDIIKRGGKRFVNVRHSKTDQEGQGIELPLNAAKKHLELCPLRALDAWLEFRGDTPGALFWKISERTRERRLVGGYVHRDEPMPWVQVNRMMTWWTLLSEVQEPDEPRYSPHSLRAGFITEAALAGQLPNSIMARSRHKSLEVFNRYVRVALDHANDPAQAVI